MVFITRYNTLKYIGFFILILKLIFLIYLMHKMRNLKKHEMDENFDENFVDEKSTLEILREDVTDCLFDMKASDENKREILSVFTSFSDILTLLKVKAVIIEPSILYCMLSSKYQGLLSKRHLNVSDFLGSRHIITYGIMEHDVAILQEEINIYKFSIMGFKVHFNQAPVTEWMVNQSFASELSSFSCHIFYEHKLCVIHIVVFYKRRNYFWHAALDTSNHEEILHKEKLLFTDHDGAYEKFSFMSLKNRILPVADFYVPSNAHYFLFEMMNSRFIECNVSHASAAVLSENLPKSHPEMSIKYFNLKTLIALRELKRVFHPLLMHLWIWSGTLLGWYRQCGIISYTTDIDFGSWASDVDDLDLITSMLQNNKHAKLKKRFGLLEEALEFQLYCHGLQTDVFFLYRVQNGSWNSGHLPDLGCYFRYYYPPFTLCSAELLGEKVLVPCETEDIIAAEYGLEWKIPVSSWNYQTSPKNRGPNVYWEQQKLKRTFQVY